MTVKPRRGPGGEERGHSRSGEGGWMCTIITTIILLILVIIRSPPPRGR
jgi:hypothetical protein